MIDESFDFAFVLPPFPFSYPPGGYDVVYKLSNMLVRVGYKVAVVHLMNLDKILCEATDDQRFANGTKKDSNLIPRFYGRVTSFLASRVNLGALMRFNKVVTGNSYDYTFLSGVRLFFITSSREVDILAENLIATSSETAYFVEKLTINKKANRYYFVQNMEDDPNFSSDLARNTYKFKLQKIVINKKMEERFFEEHPNRVSIGIDTNYFRPENEAQNMRRHSEKKITALIPFRTGIYKGEKISVELAKALHYEFPDLMILGYGNMTYGSVPHFVKFRRNVSRDELREIYRSTDIFILPSLVEGFPLPPLEAMRCGCVIIAPRIPGPEDYIMNGKNGFLVNPGDIQQYLKVVRELTSAPEMLEGISKTAIKDTEEYSLDNMFKSFQDIFPSKN